MNINLSGALIGCALYCISFEMGWSVVCVSIKHILYDMLPSGD